jgi:hypothetical protein
MLSLEAVVRMKLTSYRRKGQVHLLDTPDGWRISASGGLMTATSSLL